MIVKILQMDLLSMIICGGSILFLFINVINIFAESPSFARQEIPDTVNDWILWQGSNTRIYTNENASITLEKAKNITECGTDTYFFSPDIESISYQSDGKTLNCIIWLTDELSNEILDSLHSIDVYQEELRVLIKNNTTLEQYFKLQNSTIAGISNNTIDINSKLAGQLAHTTNYTIFTDDNSISKAHIWTEFNNTIYEVTYSTLSSNFGHEYKKILKPILESFTINKIENDFDFKENFEIYENNTIKLIYPSGWKITEHHKLKAHNISFRSPITDINLDKPSWQDIFFTMAIDVKSSFDTGTDYSLMLTRTPYSFFNDFWSKQLREISSSNKILILDQQPIDSLYDKGFPYAIPISVNLKDINYPEKYHLIFTLTNKFVLNHKLCTLVDTTNWFIIPPPVYKIIPSPYTTQLRPGDSQNVLFKILGSNNTDLPSTAIFNFIPNNDINKNNIKINIIRNETKILPFSIGTSLVNIELPKNTSITKPFPISIPFEVNITFPNSTKNKKGEEFYNKDIVKVPILIDYGITLMPPQSIEEQLLSFVNTWISPLNNLWTFLIGISSALASLILYKSKQPKNRKRK